MDSAYLGIIEGFYGRPYSKDERNYFYSFAKKNGYSFYIYAPKADLQLRDEWTKPISAEYEKELCSYAADAHKAKLDFGVALSPLNLTSKFEEQKDLLLERVRSLCQISSCEIFCLLFDDMFKDSENVGAQQNEIIKIVEQNLPEHVKHFIICPSYYTDDPVLDRIFGERPKSYFDELLKDLPQRVEIFWTGPKVLSDDITVEHIEYVTKLLGRKPFIWDNYPVNDGKNICKFLNLSKFNGRTNLQGLVTGHAVNPMVQPLLSTLPAITLPLIYQGKSIEEINQAYLAHAKELFGSIFAMILKYDNFNLLTRLGLDKMTERDKTRFIEFSVVNDQPALQEIADFIKGSQRFDQAIINGTHVITQNQ